MSKSSGIKLMKYNELISEEPRFNNSEATGPTNVLEFYKNCSAVVKATYITEDERKEFKKFIRALYKRCIIDAKKYKDTIPTCEADIHADDERAGDIGIEELVNYGEAVYLKGDVLLCVVIKGKADDKETKSKIHRFKSDEEEYFVLIVTLKLFQAIVSLLLLNFGDFNSVPPSRLCANIVSACKVPKCRPEAENWGIHGHSGLNFVAQYVKQFKEVNARRLRDKEAPFPDNGLPPLYACFMLAYKMDINSDKKQQDPKKTKQWQTLRSLSQSTGITEAEIKKMILDIDPMQWGDGYISRAQTMANLFFKEIASKEKKVGSSTPAAGVNSSSGGSGWDNQL